jgi:crossover junction endodeoxyribonuclease RuvC
MRITTSISSDEPLPICDEYRIGVDPGINGAIAVIGVKAFPDHARCHIAIFDMPTIKTDTGKVLDLLSLAEMLAPFPPDRSVVQLEKVFARPRQGLSSTWKFAEVFGAIKGVLAAQGHAPIMLTPQAWKGKWGLIGEEKDASRLMAIEKVPEIAPFLSRKKDVDRAEALLIALTDAQIGL